MTKQGDYEQKSSMFLVEPEEEQQTFDPVWPPNEEFNVRNIDLKMLYKELFPTNVCRIKIHLKQGFLRKWLTKS